MSYVSPADLVTKMIDAGEAKVFMSTRDTVIRAYMAGAILALAAAFAVTVTVQTGQPLLGALLFPVGFCLLYLMGFDLLTGVFTLAPLALIDRRPGVTVRGRAAQLGPGLRRQPRRRHHRRADHGRDRHLRVLDAAGRGRPAARRDRRGPHARLRRRTARPGC